jgi:hypothetical protein
MNLTITPQAWARLAVAAAVILVFYFILKHRTVTAAPLKVTAAPLREKYSDEDEEGYDSEEEEGYDSEEEEGYDEEEEGYDEGEELYVPSQYNSESTLL